MASCRNVNAARWPAGRRACCFYRNDRRAIKPSGREVDRPGRRRAEIFAAISPSSCHQHPSKSEAPRRARGAAIILCEIFQVFRGGDNPALSARRLLVVMESCVGRANLHRHHHRFYRNRRVGRRQNEQQEPMSRLGDAGV